jgi:hypothetical protein
LLFKAKCATLNAREVNGNLDEDMVDYLEEASSTSKQDESF